MVKIKLTDKEKERLEIENSFSKVESVKKQCQAILLLGQGKRPCDVVRELGFKSQAALSYTIKKYLSGGVNALSDNRNNNQGRPKKIKI